MSELAIIQAFEGMPDERRKQGTRHSLSLCLALFTLAVTAGNRGFLAMGDWLKYHAEERLSRTCGDKPYLFPKTS